MMQQGSWACESVVGMIVGNGVAMEGNVHGRNVLELREWSIVRELENMATWRDCGMMSIQGGEGVSVKRALQTMKGVGTRWGSCVEAETMTLRETEMEGKENDWDGERMG